MSCPYRDATAARTPGFHSASAQSRRGGAQLSGEGANAWRRCGSRAAKRAGCQAPGTRRPSDTGQGGRVGRRTPSVRAGRVQATERWARRPSDVGRERREGAGRWAREQGGRGRALG